MTMLYQDKADDGTPEFTIDKLKTIKTHQSWAKLASSIDDEEQWVTVQRGVEI